MSGRHWFVLVGGINGAGKTTFAQGRAGLGELYEDVGTALEVINPDLVTADLLDENPAMSRDEANLAAAVQCEQRVRDLLAQGTTSFSIETVLSTDKYRAIVNEALAAGFGFHFVYVLLGSVDEAIRRVALRVSRGGHDVPEARIRARWPRSLANVPWFWGQATESFVFFNGERVEQPMLVASKSNRSTTFNPEVLSVLLPPS